MNIIAEIGWNHMGDMALASKMIEEASKNGATHVKFQTWSVQSLKDGPWNTDGRKQIYEKAELTEEKHYLLKKKCETAGVKFLTSCFSSKQVKFISEISNEIKVPSTEIANSTLIDEIISCYSRKTEHHVYVSTGASQWNEVEVTVKKLKNAKMKFTILHCVSCYPTTAEMCNIPRISDLKKLHDKIGYSGHYEGIEDAIVSLEYGVSTIEKHFTTDRSLPGRDNKFAILPEDLKKLRDFIITRQLMTSHKGMEHLKEEQEMRDLYRGRWDQK